MQTLLHLIEKAGRFRPSLYLSIENPPFLNLVVEALDESGPLGLPAISVAHYGKQNGEAYDERRGSGCALTQVDGDPIPRAEERGAHGTRRLALAGLPAPREQPQSWEFRARHLIQRLQT
jgi:hypothetical protein